MLSTLLKKSLQLSCLLSLFVALTTNAQQPLTKDLVQAVVTSSEKIAQLAQLNPSLDAALDHEMLIANKVQTLQKIKALPAYPKINAIIKSAGFNNVEHYYSITTRLIGAMYASQLEQMPQQSMPNTAAMNSMLQTQIAALKQQGVPADVIKQLEASLAQKSTVMSSMEQLRQASSAADKKFATDNFDWLMKVLPMEGDEANAFFN